MKPFSIAKIYVAAMVAFLVLDMLWINVIAHGFYMQQIGYLLSPQVNVLAGVLFYLIYIGGLVYFIILPALKDKKETVLHVAKLAGIFGIVAYATYDLTNFATVLNWPLPITIVDMLWGMIVSAAAASAGYLVGKRIV